MKKTLLGLFVVIALAGCARDSNRPLEKWQNFNKKSMIKEHDLANNQSLVVFYREDDIQGPAVNVFVNGDYQASLLPNAYTAVRVCADRNLFSSSFTSTEHFGNRTQGVYYNLPETTVTYVKVSQDGYGKLSFTPMGSDAGRAAVVQLPRENQTLSRVTAKDCSSNHRNNTVVPVQSSTDVGGVKALFAFNGVSLNSMLPESKRQLENFAREILSLNQIDKIVVTGHTDPTGSDHYNQVLSQKRSEVVKSKLQALGVIAPIETVGYGATQLVVTHCSTLAPKERTQCDQPNRRVEVTVYGK